MAEVNGLVIPAFDEPFLPEVVFDLVVNFPVVLVVEAAFTLVIDFFFVVVFFVFVVFLGVFPFSLMFL